MHLAACETKIGVAFGALDMIATIRFAPWFFAIGARFDEASHEQSSCVF
jgi:hypothetical protein